MSLVEECPGTAYSWIGVVGDEDGGGGAGGLADAAGGDAVWLGVDGLVVINRDGEQSNARVGPLEGESAAFGGGCGEGGLVGLSEMDGLVERDGGRRAGGGGRRGVALLGGACEAGGGQSD